MINNPIIINSIFQYFLTFLYNIITFIILYSNINIEIDITIDNYNDEYSPKNK